MCVNIRSFKKITWKTKESEINFILGSMEIMMKQLDFEHWVGSG